METDNLHRIVFESTIQTDYVTQNEQWSSSRNQLWIISSNIISGLWSWQRESPSNGFCTTKRIKVYSAERRPVGVSSIYNKSNKISLMQRFRDESCFWVAYIHGCTIRERRPARKNWKRYLVPFSSRFFLHNICLCVFRICEQFNFLILTIWYLLIEWVKLYCYCFSSRYEESNSFNKNPTWILTLRIGLLHNMPLNFVIILKVNLLDR